MKLQKLSECLYEWRWHNRYAPPRRHQADRFCWCRSSNSFQNL